MEDLLQQVAELHEVARRLCSIWKAEEELDRWFHAQWTYSQKFPLKTTQKGVIPKTEEWKLVTARTSRRKRDFPHCLRCPCRTISLLWGLQKKDLSREGRCWYRLSQLSLFHI